jgi:hypothetical protein
MIRIDSHAGTRQVIALVFHDPFIPRTDAEVQYVVVVVLRMLLRRWRREVDSLLTVIH